ncbi:hypothetical protein Leryth_022548, partial [Lithospermum erythrorhizon]
LQFQDIKPSPPPPISKHCTKHPPPHTPPHTHTHTISLPPPHTNSSKKILSKKPLRMNKKSSSAITNEIRSKMKQDLSRRSTPDVLEPSAIEESRDVVETQHADVAGEETKLIIGATTDP